MARPKTKDWKSKTFSLATSAITKLTDLTKFENFNSESDFLEFLIHNHDANLNPATRMQQLIDEKKKLKIEMESIDDAIEETTRQMKIFEEFNKSRKVKKGQAVQIIKRKLLSREQEDIPGIAKIWQARTGIPALELIGEAQHQIQRSGI